MYKQIGKCASGNDCERAKSHKRENVIKNPGKVNNSRKYEIDEHCKMRDELQKQMTQHSKGLYMSSKRVHLNGGRNEEEKTAKIQALDEFIRKEDPNRKQQNPVATIRNECIQQAKQMIIVTGLPEGDHPKRQEEFERWAKWLPDGSKHWEMKVFASAKVTWAIIILSEDQDAQATIDYLRQYSRNHTTTDGKREVIWPTMETWYEQTFTQPYEASNYKRHLLCDGLWAPKRNTDTNEENASTIKGCLIEDSQGMLQKLTYTGPKTLTRKIYIYDWHKKEWNTIQQEGRFTNPHEEGGAKEKDKIEWEDPSGDKTKNEVWYKVKREPLMVTMNHPTRLHSTGLNNIQSDEYIRAVKRKLKP